ncbi:MAG: DUF6178 family protein, partial [Myxococcales bacterium]
ASLPQSKDVPLLDTPVGEALHGLRRKRPLYTAALSDRAAPPDQLRPFRDLDDVRRAAEAVETAERLVDVLKGLGFDAARVGEIVTAERGAEQAAFVRFSDLFLTAVAREAVGEGFSFAPLQAKSLDELAARAFELGSNPPKIRALFEKNLRELVEGKAEELSPAHEKAARHFADFCLEKLREEIGRPLAASGQLTAHMPLPLLLTGA